MKWIYGAQRPIPGESGNKINFARISFNKLISLLAGKKSYIMSDGALGLTKNLNCSFENNIYVLERCSRMFLVFQINISLI